MFNPVKALWKAGYKLADGAATRAGKISFLQEITAKEKSWFTGTLGLIIGVGVIGSAIQIAAPSLVFGGLLCLAGWLPGFGAELLGVGALASAATVFAAGLAAGGDKHCGLRKAVVQGVKKMAGGFSRNLSRTKAPGVTQMVPQSAAPDKKPAFSAPAPATASFAKAVSTPVAAEAVQPGSFSAAKPPGPQ